MKKALCLLLSTILLTLCSCSNKAETKSSDSNKEDNNFIWVLVEEKQQHSNEFSEQPIIYENHFGYDDFGRLSECIEDYGTHIYTSYDFKYDTSGKVISKTVECSDTRTSATSLSYWTYRYDEKGNLITQNIDWSTHNSTSYAEFEYNEQGDVIKETSTYTGETSTRTESTTKELTYEDGRLIQSESNAEVNSDGIKEYIYYCEKYTYDENGNMQTSIYYVDAENDSNVKNPVLINGKHYKHYSTTYYTYSKLPIIQNEMSNTTNSATIASNTTNSLSLSDNCDKVLAEGEDENGNYYELVANETEDYSGVTIEIGVIKNNTWSIPLTTNSPFIGESGLLSKYDGVSLVTGSIYDEKFAKFYYIGNGCFYYNNTILNGDNGKSYDGNESEFIPVIQSDRKNGEDIMICNDDGKYILKKYGEKFRVLDAKTMKIKTINVSCDYDIDYAFPYAEGLFACMNYSSDVQTNGFYNLKGEKVIDLSQYTLAKNTYDFDNMGGYSGIYQSLVFENGECTFKITNEVGTDYIITIDKKGNVIASEEADY